uniref:uncharacterized protein n=1 Tax=Pristiophorus japonicus TaxID=55135 RepID=UPI00398E9BD9
MGYRQSLRHTPLRPLTLLTFSAAGAGAQAGAGIKGPKPAVYGAGAFPGGYQGAGGFLGAGGYQGAGAYPGAQLATSYGNGYPSVLADGAGYGGKAGKGLDAGQALYGGQQGLANGLTVDAAAAKYGAGLPYNGQPVMPAGLGAGQLPYGMPQAGLGMLGDLAAAKYGAKDAQYQANQYYGNGNG